MIWIKTALHASKVNRLWIVLVVWLLNDGINRRCLRMAEACLGGGLGCGGLGYGCSPSIFGGGGTYLPYTGASYGGYGYGGYPAIGAGSSAYSYPTQQGCCGQSALYGNYAQQFGRRKRGIRNSTGFRRKK